jgi:hypothetical protein
MISICSASSRLKSERNIIDSPPGGLTRTPFNNTTILLLPATPRTGTKVPNSEK